MIRQVEIVLPSFGRGFHLITHILLNEIENLPEKGLLNLFIEHTSAGLTINENADPSVRIDFETILNEMVPEGNRHYTHTSEGPDDMPSHVKSSLVGHSLTIPIRNGRLYLGTWQGIYLCEFRNRPHRRRLLATLYS